MILDNIEHVRERIAVAAAKADRNPEEVDLVAVTKYASDVEVRELLRGKISQIGESRVQDAKNKREALADIGHMVRWRLIGPLQRNKIRPALDTFETLDSLASLKLAQALQTELEKRQRNLPVLCQVNLTGKVTQSGVAPGDLEDFLKEVRKLKNLRLEGLMTIAPMIEPVGETRCFFKEMKILFDCHFPEQFTQGKGPYLSMGMSRDYEIAVEEGSNLVRIGSALFAS